MSHRSNIRKRDRQKRRHAQRPQPVDKPIARIKTAGLFGAIQDRARAFDQAILETQHTR
jgi:hypothetical protein